MIWHVWVGINLEIAHNSQLLFWSLRSEKNAFDGFVKFEGLSLAFIFLETSTK